MANPTPENIVEAVGISVANKGLIAGGATGLFGWLSQANWIGIAGVVVAVIGLLVSTYFQIRRDRREAVESAARTAESAARVKALQDKCEI